MIRALITGAGRPAFKTRLVRSFKNLNTSINGYPTLFRAGEGEGGEEEEWRSASVTPLPRVGSLTATSPTALRSMGHLYLLSTSECMCRYMHGPLCVGTRMARYV